MNTYPYAKIYLRLLLVAAILVMLAGSLSALAYFGNIMANIRHYKANDTLVVDTKNLADELDAASEIVRSFIRRDKPFDFEAKLRKQKIEISETARFGGKQVERLESYLAMARAGSDELKAELLKGFQAAIDHLRASAQSALNQVEPSNTTALPASKSRETAAQAQVRAQVYPHLYDQEALAEIQLEELASVVSFLRNDVRMYGLSGTAVASGASAADELQTLTKLVSDEIRKYEQEQRDLTARHSNETTLPTTAPIAAPVTPSTKAISLGRFLAHLSVCEKLAKGKITRGWIIDRELKKTGDSISNFRFQQRERLAILRSQNLTAAGMGAGAILAAILVALLLLIVRDFLSALVDTAMNTGATAETLEKIRRGEPPSASPPGEV